MILRKALCPCRRRRAGWLWPKRRRKFATGWRGNPITARLRNVEQFISKIEAWLDAGIHVLLIDLFPPGTCDPHGMHGALGHWVDFSGGESQLSADEPLILASYRAVKTPEAFVERLSVGRVLPEMPLFFDPGRYVNLPLEATYNAAFTAMPQYWRDRRTA